MKKLVKTLSAFALGLCLSVYGQEQPKDSVSALNEVVLYGLKVPQKEALIGKNITLFNEKDIQAYQGYSLAQLINTVSGISVQGAQLPMGNTQSIYARGGRSKQVLILIDGIRVADPYSASLSYDLRLLNLSNIKQIEVLKGASSAVYGSAASTVVIAITTKENQKSGFTLTSGIGSNQIAEDQNMQFNYNKVGVDYTGSISELRYRLSYAHLYEGGVSALENTQEEDPFKRSHYSIEIQNSAQKRWNWKLKSSRTFMSADYDDSYTGTDRDFQFLTQKTSFGFQSNYRLTKGDLFLGVNHDQFDSEAISDYGGLFESNSSNFDVYYKSNTNHKIQSLFGIQSSIDASSSINESSVVTFDPYVSVFYRYTNGLNISSAARLNHHSTYGNHFVGHLNPSFSFGSAYQYVLYSSVATSFISPSLFQLYGDWGANENLTPETNTTVEFGFRSTQGSTNWNLLVFKRNENNAVFWNSESFQYDNSNGNTKAEGLEFDLTSQLTKDFQFKFNYTYIWRDQELMIRIPKHKFNLNSTYRFGKHQFLLETQFVGKRYDTDFSTYTNVELNPYTLIHLNWNHQISERIQIQCGVHNLFNKSFIEQIGFNSLGRNYRLNFNYSLF